MRTTTLTLLTGLATALAGTVVTAPEAVAATECVMFCDNPAPAETDATEKADPGFDYCIRCGLPLPLIGLPRQEAA
ncbi:hypothetical protein NN3_64000 [Nocardia neocaledoniensis NBRC 108232]|uniref:Uncharacterized protein n=1 Tax=Nocardia neocaledoniensis TaxID=236511 RepID=A0A317NR85_9NOCA|nr:hypothetical protein [Nocardia neocaledoniensis]PWV77831.1 hypothetical protein DFR69_103431 [Nocardia neocaledoniensis]GEM35393.1 hypothetical protein NN3_64000 [Nocardia neocaledoniensis NBRC 108232]